MLVRVPEHLPKVLLEPAVRLPLVPLDQVDPTRSSLMIDEESVTRISGYFKGFISSYSIKYEIFVSLHLCRNLYYDLYKIFSRYSSLVYRGNTHAFDFIFSYFITKRKNMLHQ